MDAVCLAIATVSLLMGPAASDEPVQMETFVCDHWLQPCEEPFAEDPGAVTSMCPIVVLSGTPPQPVINWDCIERPLPNAIAVVGICEG